MVKIDRNGNVILDGSGEWTEDAPYKARDATACVHQGESLRIENCDSCKSGGVSTEVFSCEIHGECTLYTISKRKPDGTRWAACSTCENLVAPTPLPQL